MDPKTMTRIEAALWSGGRVFGYSASAYLVGTIAVNGSQVPDLETAKGWALGAVYAGGAALVAFLKNVLKPRSQVVK